MSSQGLGNVALGTQPACRPHLLHAQAFPPSSLCSAGLVVSSGPFLHLLLYLPSRQSALEGMDVAADTLLLTQAQKLAGRLTWGLCASYQHKPQIQPLCPGVPFPISVPAWARNGALTPRSSWWLHPPTCLQMTSGGQQVASGHDVQISQLGGTAR